MKEKSKVRGNEQIKERFDTKKKTKYTDKGREIRKVNWL